MRYTAEELYARHEDGNPVMGTREAVQQIFEDHDQRDFEAWFAQNGQQGRADLWLALEHIGY
jgi:hypothetical protein